jgi:lipopolysaccharide transport system permease protein
MAKSGGRSGAKRRAAADAAAERQKPRQRKRSASGAPREKKPARRRTNVEGASAARADAVATAPAPLGDTAGAIAPPSDGAATTAAGPPSDNAAASTASEMPDGAADTLRVIEPPAPGLRRYGAEMWRLRAAFLFYMRRYMRKRYGRTFLGYIWLFLPTLLPLFLGALVFGGILGVSVPGVPYFLYFAVALSGWLFFSTTAYYATRSLEISRSDIRRLYIPRLIPLMAAMTIPGITFLIYVVIIACTTGFYVLERGEFYLELRVATLLVPCALVMLLVFAWACGLWFSPLAPRARDVRRLAGYAIGFWYFLTPVMYPIDEIPSGFQFLASLNPITAPIEMFKDGLLDVGDVTSLGLASYAVALVLVAGIGLLLFLPKERRDVAFY